MDYGKLDAALARAVDEEDRDAHARDLDVLVRLGSPPTADQRERLLAFDIEGAGGRTDLTATLSRHGIEALADLPWVRSIALAAERGPM
ncbi:hypothetical protein ACIQV2_12850 [Streptomyces globosus]|uniref:hypothetical protein n=1 Tax=Streptomyces globosus TaxID=68209 RepID=UPI0031DDA9C4